MAVKEEEFEVKKTKVWYRGQQYKIQGKKKLVIRGVNVIMLKIPHEKYDMWVNADYVIQC